MGRKSNVLLNIELLQKCIEVDNLTIEVNRLQKKVEELTLINHEKEKAVREKDKMIENAALLFNQTEHLRLIAIDHLTDEGFRKYKNEVLELQVQNRNKAHERIR